MTRSKLKEFSPEKWPITYGYHHVLQHGARLWNQWRQQFPHSQEFKLGSLKGYNMRGANLARVDLSNGNHSGVDFRNADLRGAKLHGSNFRGANLSKQDLDGFDLSRSDFCEAVLAETSLSDSNLSETDLSGANLKGANLSGANLRYARLVETHLERAILTGCQIYGTSVWNVELRGTDQTNLIITRPDEPTITVDNLEVAQFIYLLLNNEKIRNVIDTITSKVVLILGRFTRERKAVLDELRHELRRRNYSPILFDFEKPASRDTIETISTLAHMARFIIADLTEAKSILQELQAIIPSLPSVPIQPLLQGTDSEPGMIDHFKNSQSFLTVYRYGSPQYLIKHLGSSVIKPAENLAKKLTGG